MLTPNETDDKDDNNIIININDNSTNIKPTNRMLAPTQAETNTSERGETRQLRPLLYTYESPGTADEKRCTLHQDVIICNKKNKLTTGSVIPIVGLHKSKRLIAPRGLHP